MSATKRPKLLLAITHPFCISFIRGQAKYLHHKGFDVYLLSPDGPELIGYEEEEPCTVIRIPFQREISWSKDIKCLYLTLKAMKSIKPDVVNAGTPKAGLLCMLACVLTGNKRRIFTLRGLRSTAEPKGFKRKIVELMEKLTHALAKKVISISPSMTAYAIQRGILQREKAVILGRASSNGVNVERFSPGNKDHIQTHQYKAGYNIQDDDIVIGFVGRIVRSKGIEELYKAYASLSKQYANLKLLVVGPEETHSDSVSPDILQQMKQDEGVVLTGKIKDVEFVYPLMDIFALPSHNFREGFGNVAIEASASGVPIIVTRGAGCQDAVEDNVTGTLVSPLKVTDLQLALERYIQSDRLRKAQGKAGVEFVNSYFKNEVIWEDQYKLYKEMLLQA